MSVAHWYGPHLPAAQQQAGASAQQVTVGLIDQTGVVFAPSKINQSVSPALIDRTGSTFAPQINQSVSVAIITQTGATFAPQVNQQVVVALISSTGAVFSPTVGGQQVTVGLIDSTGATFAPQVNQSVSVALINSTGSPFAPSVTQRVVVGLIDRTGATFSPQVNLSVAPALISSTGTAFSPQVNQSTSFGLISSVGTPFAPQVNLSVAVGLISAPVSVFSPEIRWTKRNTFEGGSDETGITTGNSGGASGDAADAISIGAGGSLTFDNAHQYETLAMRVINGAGLNSYFEWNLGSVVTSYTQFLVEVAASPTGNPNLVMWRSGGSLAAAVRMSSARRISIIDGAGTQQGISTMALNTGQTYRIEVVVVGNASTGSITLNIFDSPADTTSNETVSASSINTTGALDTLRWGVTNNAANSETYWLDQLNTNNYALFGPLSAQVSPGLISSTGTPFAPTVTQQVNPALISQTGTVFSPSLLQAQQVTPGLISQVGVVFAPQITISVSIGLDGRIVMVERQLHAVHLTQSTPYGTLVHDRAMGAVRCLDADVGGVVMGLDRALYDGRADARRAL